MAARRRPFLPFQMTGDLDVSCSLFPHFQVFFSELFIWETMWWDPPAQSRRPVFAEVRDESP